MILVDILNVIFALGVTACATYKLIVHFDSLKQVERIGLGLMAGSVLMTIPPLITAAATPFDSWSPAILRLGAFLYLFGRAERLMRHRRANDQLLRTLPGVRRRQP